MMEIKLPLFADRVFIGFPKTVDEFIKQHSFKDEKEIYTNGSDLIPVSKVEQMLNHYFHYFLEQEDKECGVKIGGKEESTNEAT